LTPERWQQIERLYHAALERSADEREAFLESACPGDESLRREVASLVAAGDRIGSFLEHPTDALATESPRPPPIGQMLGHYRVLSLLGRGGMGEVYLGEDTTLGRKVAVKVLPAEFTSDPQRLTRFEREARAVSALNHPNIITIHEIGQAEGVRYLVTEYIEGETLRQRIEHGSLELSSTLEIASQVASALTAAHAAGIAHRDIKPENVMVRPDGLVKVLDFGLAKLTERTAPSGAGGDPAPSDVEPPLPGGLRTAAGIRMGTVGYMSPEQVNAGEAHAPSDIFSFGCVLYEMVTGQRAFAGQTPTETMAAILRADPPGIDVIDTARPPGLERLIRRCLEKDPAHRFQSARDLSSALKEISSASTPAGSASSAARVYARPAVWVGAVLALLLSGVVLYRAPVRDEAIRSVAILPLTNSSGNPEAEYLAEGIAEGIINDLSRVPALRVMARSTAFRYRGKDVDPRRVGRDLRVGAVLTGSLTQKDEILTIGVELVKTSDGSRLWKEEYHRDLSEVLPVQEEIARRISEKLSLRLTGEDQKRLSKHFTESGEAYRLYLLGRYHWNKRTVASVTKSIEYFGKAIAEDPDYALAYAGLADSHSVLGSAVGGFSPRETFPKARAAALKALEIDDTLAEAYAALIWVRLRYDWDWPAAEGEIRRAIELNPNYAITRERHAYYLMVMGRPDEAIAEIRRAQELDPLSLNINAVVGSHLYHARRYDEAIEQCLKTLELDPGFAQTYFFLGLAYEQKAMFGEAIAALKKATELSPNNPFMLSAVGHAYAVSGRRREAMEVLKQLHEMSRERYVLPHEIAVLHAGLGELDQAFVWLERAYEERAWRLPYLRADPRFDGMHSDERFTDLVRRVGLPS
jgi:serine/threonine protein kinase/TolB-like protein/Flp pilus assembly protein TadD